MPANRHAHMVETFRAHERELARAARSAPMRSRRCFEVITQIHAAHEKFGRLMRGRIEIGQRLHCRRIRRDKVCCVGGEAGIEPEAQSQRCAEGTNGRFHVERIRHSGKASRFKHDTRKRKNNHLLRALRLPILRALFERKLILLCVVPKASKRRRPWPNVSRSQPLARFFTRTRVAGTCCKPKTPSAAAVSAKWASWTPPTLIASRRTFRSAIDFFLTPDTPHLILIYASYQRPRFPQTPQTDGHSRQRLPDAPLQTLPLRVRRR